ncbi:hypothetical protein NE686_17385 [Tissierella carlieri]|uniref:RNA polymerase alpha subunit C-terminal domain-containing protein n=1 Tax=Tissierella carlieri TaxID=689904 RepID=A0ABT1SEG6_9FIRM|nr:DNA-directed RNA polymerase subunit alpha C-terminal domain-containing protein [Tissierella carlieri]MCQ4924879.1 hypothetical protein [Tissierella carlieri]
MRRISIRTLDISTRTRNALLRSKIEYLDDLVNMSDKDIMLKTPIGEKGIKEVRAVIKKYQEENRSNCIEIEGVVETNVDHQTFLDKFIEWVEINGWSFGGITREVNEEGDSVVSNKLSEIKERALWQNNDSTLRHDPNETDIKIANKNFEDLEEEVYGNAQAKDRYKRIADRREFTITKIGIIEKILYCWLVTLGLIFLAFLIQLYMPTKKEGYVTFRDLPPDLGCMQVIYEKDIRGTIKVYESFIAIPYWSHIKEGDYIKIISNPFFERVEVNQKVVNLE